MVAELEAAIKPFGALPHLGKLNFFSSAELRAAYPAGAVDEFTALARSHDPNGKFFNALLRAQLLGEGEAHEEYAF
jgi:xylitol oxidase